MRRRLAIPVILVVLTAIVVTTWMSHTTPPRRDGPVAAAPMSAQDIEAKGVKPVDKLVKPAVMTQVVETLPTAPPLLQETSASRVDPKTAEANAIAETSFQEMEDALAELRVLYAQERPADGSATMAFARIKKQQTPLSKAFGMTKRVNAVSGRQAPIGIFFSASGRSSAVPKPEQRDTEVREPTTAPKTAPVGPLADASQASGKPRSSRPIGVWTSMDGTPLSK